MRLWPNSLTTPGNHVLYPYRHLLSSSDIFETGSYFVLQTSLELTIYTRLAQTPVILMPLPLGSGILDMFLGSDY